nr:MATH domain and coiled-coil domain-containing protein At3g58370-like [Ziziphus jujuba var. spinosa]
MQKDILKYKRDFPPADYSLKVDSYTLLSESKTEKYDTNVFEVGGYKWRLSFYPNGDKKNNGSGYISLYLVIAETDTYAPGWKVNVDFKFLVYDQREDKYLTVQDDNGAVRRFHAMKKEWGIAQLLPLQTFKNPAFGYLVNDSCVFGVEVLIISYTGNWESISLVKEPNNGAFTWKIENFSKLNELFYYSNVFNVEGINWKLRVYPKGDGKAKDTSFSFYLTLQDWGSRPMKKAVYAEYNLRVFNQLNDDEHVEKIGSNWFKHETGWGFRSFMSLRDLRDASKGFIVRDTLIVDIVFLVISVADVSSSKKPNIV